MGVCLRREEIAREEIRPRPIKESFGGILGIINGKRLQLAGNFFYIKKKKRSAPYNNLPTHITSLGGVSAGLPSSLEMAVLLIPITFFSLYQWIHFFQPLHKHTPAPHPLILTPTPADAQELQVRVTLPAYTSGDLRLLDAVAKTNYVLRPSSHLLWVTSERTKGKVRVGLISSG